MRYSLDDTIAAIASAPGGALRGILRLSGPDALRCAEACYVSDAKVDESVAHRAHVTDGQLLAGDSRLPCQCYRWPTRRSYTGQPVVEFHTLGSVPLLNAALETVCAAGARLAEPGEFTLRAFLAGRIDLPQAEAVLGVIDADSEQQLQAALSQLAGGLSAPLHRLRNQLLDLLADIEAGLDFVDEDIQFVEASEIIHRLNDVTQGVGAIRKQTTSRMRERREYRVVFVGAANVGKSSLLNALAGREVAIVSSRAGTTRDYLTVTFDAAGVDCVFIDTAGWAPSSKSPGPAEIAQRKSAEQSATADLRVMCLDSSRPLNTWEREVFFDAADDTSTFVLTKIDLPRKIAWTKAAVETSSYTGAGIDELRSAILHRLQAGRAGDEVVPATAARCRDSLRRTTECIERAQELVAAAAGDELVAAEIRVALDELGQIAGAVYTDDVLDRIFSRFCIGK